MMEAMLAQYGAEVDTAAGAHAAMACIDGRRPDVLLVDAAQLVALVVQFGRGAHSG